MLTTELVARDRLTVFGTVGVVSGAGRLKEVIAAGVGLVLVLGQLRTGWRGFVLVVLAVQDGQVRQQTEDGGRDGSDEDDDRPADGEHLRGDQVPGGVADQRQPDSPDGVPPGEPSGRL